MMKAFIFSAAVWLWDRGQRDTCPPAHPLASALRQEHGTFPSLYNRVDWPLCSPEVRFSGVVQPQETGIAVTSRTVIEHIDELALWGNKPFSVGLRWLPA